MNLYSAAFGGIHQRDVQVGAGNGIDHFRLDSCRRAGSVNSKQMECIILPFIGMTMFCIWLPQACPLQRMNAPRRQLPD